MTKSYNTAVDSTYESDSRVQWMSMMSAFERSRWWLIIFTALVLVLGAYETASACPTCKNGLMDGDEASQRLLQGYFWSILFMMSMPFAILIGVGGYMYREVKRAQAKMAAQDKAAAEANRTPDPTGELVSGAP